MQKIDVGLGAFKISISLSILALIFWWVRPEEYVKPLIYFILIAISSIATFIAILKAQAPKQYLCILGLINFVGLLHIWTENLTFPSLIGLDPYTHMKMVTQGLDVTWVNGNIPLTLFNMGGSYSLMHLYLKGVMFLTHLDYKLASLIFVGSLQVIGNIVFIYLVGMELFNHKVGLIASLMVANANWAIFFGEWIIPNGIGVTFGLIVAYIIIKAYKTEKYNLAYSSLIFIPISLLTHLISTAWVLGTICILSILIIIKKRGLIQLILPILAIILVLMWFKFSYLGNVVVNAVVKSGQTVAQSIQIKNNEDKQASIESSSLSSTQIKLKSEDITVLPNQLDIPKFTNYFNKEHWSEVLVNSWGMIIYFLFALLGSILLFKTKANKYSLFYKVWVLFSWSILLFGFIPTLFGVPMLEHRWYYFAQVFLAIPLAWVIIMVSTNKTQWGMAIIVGVIIFFSIMGLPNNLTNRTLSPNMIVRYGLTAKEIEGLHFAEFYGAKTIGSDPYYLSFIGKDIKYDGKLEYLDKAILDADFTKSKSEMIILRGTLHKEPVGWGSGAIYRLNYNPIELSEKQGYKKVWGNSDISCLVKQ